MGEPMRSELDEPFEDTGDTETAVVVGWGLTAGDLRAMRTAAGLTLCELGLRVAYSKQAVWYWETGRHPIPAAMFLPLVEACTAARRERESRLARARAGFLALVPDAHTCTPPAVAMLCGEEGGAA